MEIKLRNVCKGYVAYACPRCVGGTMYWEQDKAYTSPYLKCLLCGEEVRQERSEKKTEKLGINRRELASKPKNEGENNRNKSIKKWTFGKKVQNC